MTNNKQQTAVEWFLIECGKYGDTAQIPDEVIDQAKEIEKQQAIKLHYEYELYVMMNESVVMTFGQFYKQTYGGGEQ
jgi:hypothetical protein